MAVTLDELSAFLGEVEARNCMNFPEFDRVRCQLIDFAEVVRATASLTGVGTLCVH